MKVTIYYKSNEEERPSDTYDIDYSEFMWLSADFEQYMANGTPKSGIYLYRPDPTGRLKKDLFLDFTKISVIS